MKTQVTEECSNKEHDRTLVNNQAIPISYFGENSKTLKILFSDLAKAYKNNLDLPEKINDDKYYSYTTEKKYVGLKEIAYTEEQQYLEKELIEETKQIVPKPIYTYPPRKKLKTYDDISLAKPIYISNHLNYNVCMRQIKGYEPIYKKAQIEKETIKSRTVTKYKNVPEYKEIQVKKFNEVKYNEDISSIKITIKNLIFKICDFLALMKTINLEQKQKLPLNLSNKVESDAKAQCLNDLTKYTGVEVMFKYLNEEWKYLEYEAQILSAYEAETIGNN
ncbi:MAG TPA: hypothetical protein LFW20_02095 [Rickettsia endosymbiont of Omalisus fontisbellaquei]|nr:hypothetical protein [Rickettsia endosymbiont of Omalisus fontisbellaquei]